MSKSRLVIDEEYVDELAVTIQNECETLSRLIAEYLNIMKSAKENAITHGETSEAIGLFTEAAECLRLKFKDVGGCLYSALDLFISEVDETDKYIY